MRKKDHAGDLKLLGIAGTHVVLLGWDLDRKNLGDHPKPATDDRLKTGH